MAVTFAPDGGVPAGRAKSQEQAIVAEVRALDTRSSCGRLLDLLAGRASPVPATR